jgi:hypothetical protein
MTKLRPGVSCTFMPTNVTASPSGQPAAHKNSLLFVIENHHLLSPLEM